MKDNWETPQWLFNELNEEFHFAADLCADLSNHKCLYWCRDYLVETIYEGVTYFMNPPYSNPYPFIEKAWEDSIIAKIVLLLPAKTDTKWFRIFWDIERHKPKDGCIIRFMPYRQNHKSRVGFVNPDTKKEQSGNPSGSMVVIFDRRFS
jgi:phage N-6-adenine-methyltransferase